MDIQLKVGSDASSALDNLAKLRGSMEGIKEAQQGAKRGMEETFIAAAEGSQEAAQQLNEYIKLTKQQADAITALEKKLKDLEKTSEKAFGADEAKAYQAQIKQLEQELKRLKDDTKKFGDETSNSGKKASASMQTLLGVLDAAKAKLVGLKEGTQEFDALSAEIKAAELAMVNFKEETEDSGDQLESARKKLREFQVALQNPKLAGLDQTEVYAGLRAEAGELRDTIADVNEEINAVASDTSGIDRIIRGVQLATNAFGIYEGVVALTGNRNEAFEKTLIRLNALLTISNGIQQVLTELRRKDNVLVSAQIALQKAYAFVVGTSTGAMKTFRIALAGTGIGLVVIGLITLIEKMNLFSDAADEAAQSQKDFNEQLAAAADAGKSAALAFVRNEEALAIARARAAGKGEADIVAIQEKFNQERIRVLQRNLQERKRLGQDYLDVEQEIADLETEIQVARLDAVAELNEARRKKQEKIDQDNLQAAQDRAKRIAELEKQLAEAQIAALADGRQKEIAEENRQYAERIAALKENYGKAYGRELQLIQANIEQENANHKARLLAIDADYYKNAQTALQKANDEIADILTGGEEGEIAQVREKYAAVFKTIEEASKEVQASISAGLGDPFADNEALAALRRQASQVTTEQQKAIDAIRAKFQLQRLEKQEQLALAENEVLQVQGVDQQALEEMKEQAKLDIIVAFARQRIEILKAIGTEEAQLQILQLEKVIQDASKKKDTGKKGTDLFTLLGLKLDEKTKQDIVNGFGVVLNSINTLFNQSVQSRIDESQRLIDALNDQISEQEELVDKEKALAEKGYANNLSIEEKKLDDLKRQKEQEAATLKKAQAEQAKFAAVQVALNGIVSATNLAVSASTYFKESSKFGPIAGTILALAAIATMLTTFAATKKQAESISKFHQGGELDLTNQRTTHEQGGIGLYDGASGKKIAEARGGEYAYFFKDGGRAKQFKPLFEAINEGRLPKLPRLGEFDLSSLRLLPEALMGRADQKQTTPQANNGRTEELLGMIAENTGAQTTYENGYRVERRKNHIRRVKINA